ETESTDIHRTRYRRPRCGFFRNRERAGMSRVQHFIQMLEETDRFEVLTAAKGIWNPLARLPRVVEIEHRRDRIHAQTVQVILVDPEERIRDEIVLHFVAPVVEDR